MPFGAILPELVLAVGGMFLLLLGAFRQGEAGSGLALRAAVLLLVATGLGVGLREDEHAASFGGVLVLDGFATYAKVLALLGTAVALAISHDYLRRNDLLKVEYPVLFVFAALGMSIMVSASDLISLYMGLELQSLCLYVLAAFRRDALRSTEAGLKYFVLGALSSGLLLYGASLVYGYTGSTSFESIAAVIRLEGASTGLVFGLVFLTAGIAFKVSAVPFHMWTPDVYEGSPGPVTAFFASAPKIAAAALFARLLFEPFGEVVHEWRQILIFLSVASMFVGAVAAIGQTNIKRLMAYSSIGHTGYALVGLAAGTEEGVASLLLYLTIYLVMNLGMFAFIVSMARDGNTKVRIQDLAGLSQNQPVAALCLAVLLFSLAGLPPLVGFFGKFFVFRAAVDAGLAPLAIAGVVASVIAAFYYLRIVKVMYIDEPGEALDRGLRLEHRLVLVGAALTMTFSWLPFLDGFGVIEMSANAAAALLR